MTLVRGWKVVLLAFVLACCATASRAAEHDTSGGTDENTLLDGWQFDVEPYLWIPAVKGTVSADGRTAGVDVGFDEIFDLIGDGFSLLAGMAHFEARHARVAVFLDFAGIKLDTDDSAQLEQIESPDYPGLSTTRIKTKVHLKQDQIFLEFGAAYRLLELAMPQRARPFTLEALAGGRYMYYWTSVSAEASTKIVGLPGGSQGVRQAASGHQTLDWVDPFIGGRFTVPLTDDIGFSFRGDIGGFGAGSDLAWSLVSNFMYDLPWHPYDARTWFAVGYKVLAYKYDTGNANIDLQYRGPAVGLGAAF
jgi:hypothetical protein